METVITMIILTGTAVLFLSNVFRQVRDERERSQQRRVNVPRRPAASTEQFLEEVNRRRQQAGERAKSRPPVRPISLTPAPAPPSRRDTSARKVPPKADRPRQTSVKAPFVIPAGKMMEVVPADKPAESKLFESAPVQQPADQPTRPAPKVTSRPLPVLLAQLKPLLQSRQTLRAALLLHEILGPPLSQRKRS
jgi:hypothetical protein